MNRWTDTSVLVRLITKQPPELYEAAAALLERVESEGFRLYVHPVHVAETTFVLAKVYGYSRPRIAQDLTTLLSVAVFSVADFEETWAALHQYAVLTLDFPDIFLAELARSAGAGVAAFDRDYRKLDVPWLDPSDRSGSGA